MLDILLPRCDAAVVIQLTIAATVGGFAIYRTWANSDRRIFAIGGTVLMLALLGIRAVH